MMIFVWIMKKRQLVVIFKDKMKMRIIRTKKKLMKMKMKMNKMIKVLMNIGTQTMSLKTFKNRHKNLLRRLFDYANG